MADKISGWNLGRSNGPGEKRKGEAPIPVNLRGCLSRDQIASIREMDSFGWQLAFVRRSNSPQPLAVVSNKDKSVFAVLEEDGSINTSSEIAFR